MLISNAKLYNYKRSIFCCRVTCQACWLKAFLCICSIPKVSNMNVNATREVRVTFIRPLGTRLMWTHRYPTSRCLQSRGLCASAATAGLPIFCLIWLLLLVLLLALSFVIVPLQSSRPAHPTLGALACNVLLHTDCVPIHCVTTYLAEYILLHGNEAK